MGEVVDAVIRATWAAVPSNAKHAALQRVSQRAVVDRLITLAADRQASPDVRALADLKLRGIAAMADARRTGMTPAARAANDMMVAHYLAVAGDITRWLERQELPTPTPALVAPPGDPFGMP